MKTKLLILSLIFLAGCSKQLGATKVWEKAGNEHLKLKTTKENILNAEDEEDGIKSYIYKSDKKEPQSALEVDGQVLTEEISKRTKNAKFYKKGTKEKLLGGIEKTPEEEWVGQFYTGDTLYQDPSTADWYIIEHGTTTIEAYNEQTATTVAEMILDFIGVETSLAACGTSGDPCYTGAGDGSVVADVNTTTWTAVVNRSAGTSVAKTNTAYVSPEVYLAGATNHPYIVRGFYPADTSAIDNSATITGASLKVWVASRGVSDNDTWAYQVLVNNTQSSDTDLVVGDYSKIGTTTISDSLRMASTTTGGYNTYTLSDLSVVSKTGYTKTAVRAGHDRENVSLSAANDDNYCTVYYSEQTGTANDPYYVITFTTGGAVALPDYVNITNFE